MKLVSADLLVTVGEKDLIHGQVSVPSSEKTSTRETVLVPPRETVSVSGSAEEVASCQKYVPAEAPKRFLVPSLRKDVGLAPLLLDAAMLPPFPARARLSILVVIWRRARPDVLSTADEDKKVGLKVLPETPETAAFS